MRFWEWSCCQLFWVWVAVNHYPIGFIPVCPYALYTVRGSSCIKEGSRLHCKCTTTWGPCLRVGRRWLWVVNRSGSSCVGTALSTPWCTPITASPHLGTASSSSLWSPSCNWPSLWRGRASDIISIFPIRTVTATMTFGYGSLTPSTCGLWWPYLGSFTAGRICKRRWRAFENN